MKVDAGMAATVASNAAEIVAWTFGDVDGVVVGMADTHPAMDENTIEPIKPYSARLMASA